MDFFFINFLPFYRLFINIHLKYENKKYFTSAACIWNIKITETFQHELILISLIAS